MIDDQLNAIRKACTLVIGKTIQRFETAEIQLLDGSWDDWHDLPFRVYCTDQALLSIAWSQFDQLWLSNDTSLPFDPDDAKTRWKSNGIDQINAAIGCVIRGVLLGRGEMTIESREVEIWTRLLFDLDGIWLEVFNALDENGYDLHHKMPDGDFRIVI